MDLNFLKNPIIIAIVVGILTYLYLYWDNERKYKNNPKIKKESVSFVIPAVVAVITWFITNNLFKKNKVNEITKPLNEIQSGGIKLLETNPIINKIKISERLTDSFDSNTFHLIGKNAIKLPQTDVFIDIAKF